MGINVGSRGHSFIPATPTRIETARMFSRESPVFSREFRVFSHESRMFSRELRTRVIIARQELLQQRGSVAVCRRALNVATRLQVL